MKKLFLILFVVCSTCLNAQHIHSVYNADEEQQKETIIKNQLLSYINQYRKLNKRSPLLLNDSLNSVFYNNDTIKIKTVKLIADDIVFEYPFEKRYKRNFSRFIAAYFSQPSCKAMSYDDVQTYLLMIFVYSNWKDLLGNYTNVGIRVTGLDRIEEAPIPSNDNPISAIKDKQGNSYYMNFFNVVLQ